jgi:serine/threonine protein kinase
VTDALNRLKTAVADRYVIERELGQGGMATVYLARDLKHKREVALKVLRPELAASIGGERFLREITLTAGLHHPHILPLLDSGDANGQLFYVMPYVAGESLRDRLNRERQLPLDDALQIARDVADALSYAHSRDVVHRDIKPENILLESGHAVVADFGVARAITTAGGNKLTETGIAVGTVTYMSPEQSTGERLIDGRSDLYSLGCVLYEMLAGEPPYSGASAQAILAKRLTDPVPRVSLVRATVPGSLDSAIRKALASTPADRFATMSEFLDALAGRPASRAPQATPNGGPPRSEGASWNSELVTLIAKTQLTMKSDISYLAFKTTDEIVKAVSDLARQIPRGSDDVFFVNQGGGVITIICDAVHEKLVAGLRYQALDYRSPVGVLRIQEAHDDDVKPGIEVPGLYAYFLGELAHKGINLLDMISTRSQLTLLLAEGDLTPAFVLLTERIRDCRRAGIG